MESSGKVTATGKLSRQRSRLQMHAPSSIQVAAPPAAAVAEWNVAIPLLSPLDIVSLPIHHCDPKADDDADTSKDTRRPSRDDAQVPAEEEAQPEAKWATWQHPAAPFYYEPVAGNGPALLLPHCAYI